MAISTFFCSSCRTNRSDAEAGTDVATEVHGEGAETVLCDCTEALPELADNGCESWAFCAEVSGIANPFAKAEAGAIAWHKSCILYLFMGHNCGSCSDFLLQFLVYVLLNWNLWARYLRTGSGPSLLGLQLSSAAIASLPVASHSCVRERFVFGLMQFIQIWNLCMLWDG